MHEFFVKHEKKIGAVASIFAVIMFISLIEILMSNLRGDSHILFQPLATSANGFLWCMYAYAKRDVFLLIPNSLALVIGAVTAVSAFI